MRLTKKTTVFKCFLTAVNLVDDHGFQMSLRIEPRSFRWVISSSGFPGSSADKESSCNVGDLGLIPGLGRSPGGGHGSPLQYSCLENPHGQEPGVLQSMGSQRVRHYWATKHSIAQSLPQVSFWGLLFGIVWQDDHGQLVREKGMVNVFIFENISVFLLSSRFFPVSRSDVAVLLWSSEYAVYQRMCWFCMSLNYVGVEQTSSRNESRIWIPNTFKIFVGWFSLTWLLGWRPPSSHWGAWEPRCMGWQDKWGSNGPSLELGFTCSWTTSSSALRLLWLQGGWAWPEHCLWAGVNLAGASAPERSWPLLMRVCIHWLILPL